MIASIITNLIEWFLSKFIVREVKAVENKIEAKETAQKDTAQLESAKTDEEKAAALDSISRNTFN